MLSPPERTLKYIPNTALDRLSEVVYSLRQQVYTPFNLYNDVLRKGTAIMKVIYAPLSRQIQRLTEAICHFISPPCCTICNAPLHEHSEILCAGCLIEFVLATQVPYCPTCGTNCGLYALLDDHCHFCYHKKNIITRTVRVSSYQGPIKKIIGQLKFNGQTRFDKYLGTQLAAAIIGDTHFHDIDIIVPIPLHWRRHLHRTYNQSTIIANITAGELRKYGLWVPVNNDLIRKRKTPPQIKLSRKKRLENLKEAFAIRKDAPFIDKHICLIDDVTTTGATLHMAAQLLKKFGCKKISAAVIAVTPIQ